MKKMKFLVSVLAAVFLLISFIACSGSSDDSTPKNGLSMKTLTFNELTGGENGADGKGKFAEAGMTVMLIGGTFKGANGQAYGSGNYDTTGKLPDGLLLEVTKKSDTELTFKLKNSATKHTKAYNDMNLMVQIKASGVTPKTGVTFKNSDLKLTIKPVFKGTPEYFSKSVVTLTDGTGAKKGMFEPVVLTLNTATATFKAVKTLVKGTDYTVENTGKDVPYNGISPVLKVTQNNKLEISITGSATKKTVLENGEWDLKIKAATLDKAAGRTANLEDIDLKVKFKFREKALIPFSTRKTPAATSASTARELYVLTSTQGSLEYVANNALSSDKLTIQKAKFKPSNNNAAYTAIVNKIKELTSDNFDTTTTALSVKLMRDTTNHNELNLEIVGKLNTSKEFAKRGGATGSPPKLYFKIAAVDIKNLIDESTIEDGYKLPQKVEIIIAFRERNT